MTSKRTILLFWALFLVPTLIIAGIAFNLLVHEQERLNRMALNALSERSRTIADTIHLTVQAVQETLGRSLVTMAPDNRLERLKSWEVANPLVRNIFIINKEKHLEYPVPGMASTPEERRFIIRYDSLFSGRLAFDFNQKPSQDESKPSGQLPMNEPVNRISAPDRSNSDKTAGSRNYLIAMAKAPAALPREISAQHSKLPHRKFDQKAFSPRTGWIPWFNENRLFILGWVQQQPNGPIYGIELELMALLSQLVVDFPHMPDRNAAIVLMDGNGDILHQAGNLKVLPQSKPTTAISVTSLLPHWKIAVFTDKNGLAVSRGFLYLALVLLGIFVAAIVSGGALLTRLTLKNMKDARQKTSFVSSVSHELKTPLTSIRMYAELLQSNRITDAGKISRYLSIIVDETQRLTRLINNILDFGKLEQGKKRYQTTSFDLPLLLNNIIDAHSIRMHGAGLKIIREFAPEVRWVSTDPDALEQVILNLLDNVLKYASGATFIKFILDTKDFSPENSWVYLKICDDGPGIPKNHQQAIFVRFHRVDNALTAKHPGSGLGLSISRKILQDLGGDLVLEKGSTSGCCFSARIKKND